jgi:hypothetical protein
MSFDNNLLTEVKGIEYVVDEIVYMLFFIYLADNANGIIKGDINLKEICLIVIIKPL